MSATWREEDEELRAGGVKGGLKPKPRFSYNEVKLLLDEVKKNRYILLRKFNQGVSAETKKQTWADITDQINSLGENHREVRQIMKKWTDLKCDGKRRILALRGPNGCKLRKKKLGPVERMVHRILMMSPKGDGDSDTNLSLDEDLPVSSWNGATLSAPPYSYLNYTHCLPEGVSFDISPLSSPEKEAGDRPHSSPDFDLVDDAEQFMNFGENEDSVFSSLSTTAPPPTSTASDPLPINTLLRIRPLHTYARPIQNHTQDSTRSPPGTSSSFADPPPSPLPTGSNVTPSSLLPPSSSSTSATTNNSASHPATSSTSLPPPPPPFSAAPPVTPAPSSLSHQPPPPSSPSSLNPADPLPPGWSQRGSQEHVAQLASQSLQQQRASRMLLTSVSRSLETLAQSVQLLVESQQEFVQESLLLQRETVDILRDFSNTALKMLKDKSNSGQQQTRHPPPPLLHHPTSRF